MSEYDFGIHDIDNGPSDRPLYEIDLAMCGPEFTGDLEAVAGYLTAHRFPAVAIYSAYNGATNEDGHDPPEDLWLAALESGESA
jgi:hypothetical protein